MTDEDFDKLGVCVMGTRLKIKQACKNALKGNLYSHVSVGLFCLGATVHLSTYVPSAFINGFINAYWEGISSDNISVPTFNILIFV